MYILRILMTFTLDEGWPRWMEELERVYQELDYPSLHTHQTDLSTDYRYCEVHLSHEVLYSVQIEADSSHSVTLNGTTLKMESGYYEASDSWRPIGSSFKVHYSIDCSDGYQIEKLYSFAGDVIPVKGGVECIVEIFPTSSEIALIYSETNLLPLN